MRVKNLNGLASSDCSGADCLLHWEKLSGQSASMCFAEGCMKRPSAGGHVQKVDAADTRWYVIPLCEECNKKMGQELAIWDTATLVSATGVESDMDSAKPRSFVQWAKQQLRGGG